jgi:hypothetical protein
MKLIKTITISVMLALAIVLGAQLGLAEPLTKVSFKKMTLMKQTSQLKATASYIPDYSSKAKIQLKPITRPYASYYAPRTETKTKPSSGDLNRLPEFVKDAYARHGASDFSKRIHLQARVVSSLLALSGHHHRLVERASPDFEGYFLAIREPKPRLKYIAAPFFNETEEYSPDAPLKEMVILEVTGKIESAPLTYEAFIFRFVSPEGSCHVKLSDPVFPGVNNFSSDKLLALVFPECEGPQAARERALLEAVPGLVVTGFDDATGALIATRGTKGRKYSKKETRPSSTPESMTGPRDGCGDYIMNARYGWDSSEICSDLWWGYGNWVRGGNWWQKITCIPEGKGCGVQTVNSGDNLHSSIRPAGWGHCSCCDNYGATITGRTASARLASDAGTTGGHVAIAKSVRAYRTSESQSMTTLGLEGQCGGDLDLPHHGSSANASGSIDYEAKTSQQQNKAEVGGWNAENITSHLCKRNRK